MARFLIGTIPAFGHVNPALPIARKLVERGHQVWWYTGIGFQSQVEQTGARHVPIRTGIDFTVPDTIPESLKEEGFSLKGLAQFKFCLKHLFVDSAAAQLKDLTEILQKFPADVVLSDLFFLGASWVHKKGGPPWATLGTTGLFFSSCDTAPFGLGMQPDASALGRFRNYWLNRFQQFLFKDVTVYLDQVRGSIGLSPDYQNFFDASLSPFLYLQQTVPSFEYPRSDLPPQVHFIGASLPEQLNSFTPPSWWDELNSGKVVVHVTQGTVSTEADDLIVPTIKAFANDEDVLVVATTGGKAIDSFNIDPMPTNVRLEQFIPHEHLMPHVDVMVTNGGPHGVHMALANGVPLVAAGQTEDKPEICARIEWAGVGVNLKTKKPHPTQLKNAVQKILASPHYRQKAQLLKADIARYDAPTEAAVLLEQLASTKQPVFKKTSVHT
ncbi:MAG: hypothetical protein KME32_17505 [Mojavia pulchra JT2-VF2]|jgi:UDP:flavonoid glycosyltransferase YjiC (YdhE family)|uniref:Erythromycin biosynthesis protein CIII-like C-terminal domain-containing protein n=1 Tax=Mojavia pulchra JT2-VF2 TaxID=287848 RepID=A0A951UH94_9NOST|nr:hypothetical protein [Mojavia pulchra JT2-VF2]